MTARAMTQHVSSALNALKQLLALVGVAAIFAFLLSGHRAPVEKVLPLVVIDQLIEAPAPVEGPIQVSVAEVALNREQQVVAEFIAKRYRVAEDAAGEFVAVAYRAGARFSLDPLLILAVMAIESRYNPVAESVMGARGLMQVIPKYHPEKLEPHGGEQALLEPEVNILIGAQILREYHRRLGGNTEAALQMYNGAFDEPTSQYANKVFAEKARLEALRLKTRKSAQSA
ncbi:MAG TPA: lytic transglycosylase domain-containing protein [Burkholderiales bacterium]|nr:lytic transglycosylase domain-containing protein [Burkholderiales bacterium]